MAPMGVFHHLILPVCFASSIPTILFYFFFIGVWRVASILHFHDHNLCNAIHFFILRIRWMHFVHSYVSLCLSIVRSWQEHAAQWSMQMPPALSFIRFSVLWRAINFLLSRQNGFFSFFFFIEFYFSCFFAWLCGGVLRTWGHSSASRTDE